MIVDAWAQHPTLRHSQDPIFDSLRRWTKRPTPTEELLVKITLDLMDQGGVGGHATRGVMRKEIQYD